MTLRKCSISFWSSTSSTRGTRFSIDHVFRGSTAIYRLTKDWTNLPRRNGSSRESAEPSQATFLCFRSGPLSRRRSFVRLSKSIGNLALVVAQSSFFV
jgi:hypothetical protein